MSFDPLAFIAEFRTEASEHLAALDEQLLQLESSPLDPQPVRAMFLAAHSIKGGAAMLGLDELRELSHALEDVLGVLRDQRRPLDAPTAGVLFQALDQLRSLVAQADGTPRPSTSATLDIIAALADSIAEPRPAPEPEREKTPRVLLVEDSPTVRQVETFLLEDAGFIVDTATTGAELLERVRSGRYVLVIAGVETRDLRPPNLVQGLRDIGPDSNVPVLLTSTDGSGTPAATGDLAFIPKGRLDEDEFVRHVREMTARRARFG